MSLSATIADCLHRHGLANTAGVIAVSGGPDSVALAHLCVGLIHEGKIARLIFAHVNHQLRGAESDADESFVKQMADDTRITCKTTRIGVAAIAEAEKDNLESIARRERYRWLAEVAHEEGAAWIATGHNADDQAETVLFRLLRGSGLIGLGGMSERRPIGNGLWLIRPLISTRRQELHDYLRAEQIPYRVDSSNRDLRFTRNRLRLELLPMLEEHFNPAAVNVLCRLADQVQEVSAIVVGEAGRLRAEAELPRAGAMLVFSVERLGRASANLVREMFRLVWQREGWPMGDMDFARWNRLIDIVTGSCPAWDFPGRVHARRVGKVIQIHTAFDR
jgi:tRNA(Ile)-lysidine synthase